MPLRNSASYQNIQVANLATGSNANEKFKRIKKRL